MQRCRVILNERRKTNRFCVNEVMAMHGGESSKNNSMRKDDSINSSYRYGKSDEDSISSPSKFVCLLLR
jgi:hypothetical protein